MEKKRKGTKHRKTRDFLAVRGGSAAGAAAPLSYGEERTAVRQCGFKRLRATAGQGPNYVGLSCGDVGLCWPILRAMLAQLGAMLD